MRFEVNLSDYLDTGLFLDHRPLRRRIARALFGSPPEPYVPRRDERAGETIEGSFRRLDD